MKKKLFIAFMIIFTWSATTTFASKSDSKSNAPLATENKLSESEVNRLKNRVEEIRDMDKSEMTASEKKELRNETKNIKKNVRKSGEVIYLSGGVIILIIVILLLL